LFERSDGIVYSRKVNKEIWKKSVVDKFSCWIFFIIFILSAGFKAPPAVLIILAIVIGLWLPFARKIEHGGEKK